MTNLSYSLDLVKCVTENDMAFQRSIDFLNSDKKNRKVYIEPVTMIQQIDRLVLQLIDNSGLTLEDGENSVNFYALVDAIKSGRILDSYRSVKVIRAEMLVETNADNLEEFKTLSEFWETVEICLAQLLK